MFTRVSALTLFLIVSTYSLSAMAFMDFTHMKPYEGPWGGKVTLYGKNFDATQVKVYFNNKPLKPIKVTKRTIQIEIPDGTRSGWIEVEQGRRRLRAPKRFVIKNKTLLKSITPSAGPAQTWVTARGLFFKRTTKFYLGYMNLPTKYVNFREVKIFIPKGIKSGFLAHTSLGRKVNTRVKYSIKPFPVITDFAPKTGWRGTRITVSGRHFCPDATISLNGKPLKTIRKNARQLVVSLPAGVTTGTPALNCFGRPFSLGAQLTVRAPFGMITQVTPTATPPARWVTLKGSRFTRRDRFWIGKKQIRKVKFITPSEVRVFIPKGAVTDIFHHQSFGRIRPSSVLLVIDFPPVVADFSPRRGWYGTKVTVKGRHFCPAAQVTLGGRVINSAEVHSKTRLTFTLPTLLKGGALQVTCRGWTSTSRGSFTLEPPRVVIKRISPEVGPPGTTVTLRGENFPSDMKVLWNNKPMATTVIDHSLATIVISGRGKGALKAYAYRRYYPSPANFTVAWPKPLPTGFGPRVNWHRGTVRIVGSHFCKAPVVQLVHPKSAWKKSRLTVLKNTGRALTVMLPQKAFAGYLQIQCYRYTVRVPGGSIALKPPVGNIASIYPKFGPPGTWVTINGSRFRRSLRFYLGTKPLTSRFISANRVQVLIPTGATTGAISVQTGRTRVKTAITFKVGYPMPVIGSVTPDMGWVGDTMVIKGRNFCPGARVLFPGNIPAKVIRQTSHTILNVRIPKNAQSGYIQVVCASTRGTARGWFTMAPPYARVHKIAPTLACPGDKVTIKGINFTAAVRFFIGARVMPAKVINQYKAVATIPVGARSGDVKVASFGKRLPTTQSIIIKSRLCKNRKK